MADQSWVVVTFASSDPEIVQEVISEFGYHENITEFSDKQVTIIEGEQSYGIADTVTACLREKGVAYSRYSDGKYEYDGDEEHWTPDMEEPRVFTSLNNGGRVLTVGDIDLELSDEEIGAKAREFATFEAAVPYPGS